jgi:nitrogen fixation NifU-like protein|nr:SUF system NifU family Fe-S cluster assembly protein [Microbacterium bovistercoris]
MSGLESLYQDLILDHSRTPHGFGLSADEHAATSRQRNPVCGDEVTLRVRVDGDVVRDVTWEGSGCSISQASASMLAVLVDDADGMSRAEASALIASFREALRSRGETPLDEERFGDAAALSGVSKYTARVKCAMLAWVALEDALSRA